MQLERLTAIKHDNKMHQHIYNFLKSKKLISSSIYDIVFVDNIVGRSFISSEGNIRFEAPLKSTLEKNLEKGRCWWFDKEVDAYVLNHELAHLFSCLPFYGIFKDNSLLIHFDGGASQSNFSAWTYKNNKLSLFTFHWDLKYLTSFYNANALNFFITGTFANDQNSMAGKLMGYAAYGNYKNDIEEWLKKNNYFQDIWKNKKQFFSKLKSDWNIDLSSFDQKYHFIQDIASTFQGIFEREVLKVFENLKKKTGAKYLYYTGGAALNITANSRIVNDLDFDDVYIPPCTNDTGIALGAGAFVEYAKHKKTTSQGIYLNNWGIEDYSVQYGTKEIEMVANLLLQNKIIGICNGYGEIGPRALGNRSIIALANSKELAKEVSMKCKKREWYRPVAPIMLGKNALYFTGEKAIHHLSKYMLLEYTILTEKRKEIEGVVHVNNTARIQTLFKRSDNEFMYDLLEWMDEKHDVKALINTSFNIKGKPMVHTTENAYDAAKEMKLDALVMNGRLMVLK